MPYNDGGDYKLKVISFEMIFERDELNKTNCCKNDCFSECRCENEINNV